MDFMGVLALACLLVSVVNLVDWRFHPGTQWVDFSPPSRVMKALIITWIVATVVTSVIGLARADQAYLSAVVGVAGTIGFQADAICVRHRGQKG